MKKIFSLVIAIAPLSITLHAQQAPAIEWQNDIGGNQFDELTSIQQTSDGGYIVGGYSGSGVSGDKTDTSRGSDDYWVMKLNNTGDIEWQNTIGGSGTDDLESIQQTSDGGYILGGYSDSGISGDKTEGSQGYIDYWIVKLNNTGSIEWQNDIGGDEIDQLQSIQQTIDGGYILAGFSFSGLSGDKTETSQGGEDYWVVKLDNTGSIEWQNDIGGSNNDELYRIQQTSDGGYILGGHSKSGQMYDKTEPCLGQEDYWVVKLGSTGAIEWQNTIGGNDIDLLFSVQQTFDGGYILGGRSMSGISGDKTEASQGNYDYWIVKLNNAGAIEWQNAVGGSGGDGLWSIRQTSDGGYFVGGWSMSGISGDKTEDSVGARDYWVMKLESAGSIVWQKTIGGSDLDVPRSMQQTSDGGYIIGGYTTSGISGDKTEPSQGDHDYWIIKLTDSYNSITGTLFIDANSNNVQDAGETSLQNITVAETDKGRLAFSHADGSYNITVLDTGNFEIAPNPISYYNTVPPTQDAHFTAMQQTDSLNDFAFQPAGTFNDLCVTITPVSAFRPGWNATYIIDYENVGTTTLTPGVVLFPDDSILFVSSDPAASMVTADSVTWNFNSLAPFQSGSIVVSVYVDSIVQVGTSINSNVRIDPVAGDANPACNTSSWEVFTTGSFDPNEIVVDQPILLTNQFPSPPYLEYIIRFQNTGNDTAFNVKILNPVDTNKLDLSSFEFVGSSHPITLDWKSKELKIEFKFDNILLPDSNINEPASHGFVRYRIKPKETLFAGDSIVNNAAIYFDYNTPVQTNDAVTTIDLATSAHEVASSGSSFILYPNPASDFVTIQFRLTQSSHVRMVVCDMSGREILTPLNGASQSGRHSLQLNPSKFAKGIYVVKMIYDEGMENRKLVVQ